MAGGMNKRGSYGSMAERVSRSQERDQPADVPEPTAPPEPPTLKHCWVTDRHGRLPALLLEWRRRESGYQGRVVRPVLDEEGWAVVEEWLPAEMLEPASG